MRSNYCALIDSWSSQDYALCIFLWTCIASRKSGFVFLFFLLKNPTLRVFRQVSVAPQVRTRNDLFVLANVVFTAA